MRACARQKQRYDRSAQFHSDLMSICRCDRARTSDASGQLCLCPRACTGRTWNEGGRSARFETQGRRQDFGPHHLVNVGARLVIPQEFAARSGNCGGVARRDRMYRKAPAGKLQRRGPAGCEIPVPSPLGAAPRTHEDLVVGHHYPDHQRGLGVLLGPDRDLPHVAQFAQGSRFDNGEDGLGRSRIGNRAAVGGRTRLEPARSATSRGIRSPRFPTARGPRVKASSAIAPNRRQSSPASPLALTTASVWRPRTPVPHRRHRRTARLWACLEIHGFAAVQSW